MSAKVEYDRQYLWESCFPEPNSGCWIWMRGVGDGYGKLAKGGNAHRQSFKVYISDEIPPGMDVDHQCNNRTCINPAHLKLMTKKENVWRRGAAPFCWPVPIKKIDRHGLERYVRGICKHGHVMHLANDGRMRCKGCWTISNKKARERKTDNAH